MRPLIYIGLTGWGDHDSLYPKPISNNKKLQEYAAHFPIVELDASFYAIQPLANMKRWVEETPATFQFIVKAYQGMTGHIRDNIPFSSKDDMFSAFIQSLAPLAESNKLAMALFQFPPWFDCRKEHVQVLRYCRRKMGNIPVAIEFRHQSWFAPEYYHKTLQFLKNEGWIHSICDEPQAGVGSVPTVLVPTDSSKTLIRFHGRNAHGWTRKGSADEWRKVRYLYRYSEEELRDWIPSINMLKNKSKDVYIIFNNNSGKDAADNAKQLISMLGITYKGLAPKQLQLF